MNYSVFQRPFSLKVRVAFEEDLGIFRTPVQTDAVPSMVISNYNI